MIKYFLWMLFGAGVTTGIIYGIPDDLKQQALAFLSRPKVIPLELRSKIESLLMSPAEQRALLLKELENNLQELKTAANQNTAETDKKIIATIVETEKLIEELKKKNEEKPGVVESTVRKIIEETVSGVSGGGGGSSGGQGSGSSVSDSGQKNSCPQ